MVTHFYIGFSSFLVSVGNRMVWEESGSYEATVIVQEERGTLEIWTKETDRKKGLHVSDMQN